MKKVMYVIKKIVLGLCMLYTINVLISKTGNVVPINIYSIGLVSALGIPGIISLLILKKLIV